jgi:transposase
MRHRGHKKAVVTVAHALVITVNHVLARQTAYQEPGVDYYDRRHTQRVTRRAVDTLERQGFRVRLERTA